MIDLSIGKRRGLQQCSTARGAIAVLALDHRGNLRKALRPDSPDAVSEAEIVEFKQQVVSALGVSPTAFLLDPEYGAAHSIAAGTLPGSVGLLVAVEQSGYTGEATARVSQVLPGWSAAQAKRMGASAVKFLVYYHPEASTAGQIEALVRQVVDECAAQDLALFLEILTYPIDPAGKKLGPDEVRRVVVESARRLVIPGVDVLKAEFPLDVAAQPDERVWAEACAELSAVCPVPWVVLSGSSKFETFLRQVTVACRAGASGVAVGRAVWREATSLAGQARVDFLRNVARPRMARITEVCDALARPWVDFFAAPQLGLDWYTHF